MGTPGNRIRRLVYRCLRFRGLVHGLGAQAWIRSLRRVSNYRGNRNVVLVIEAGRLMGPGSSRAMRCQKTHTPHIPVAYRIVFGIVVLLLAYFQMGSAR